MLVAAGKPPVTRTRCHRNWRDRIWDRCAIATRALGVALAVSLTLSAQPAFADFRIVDHFDPETGIKSVGLRIESTDKSAALLFLCQSLNDSPRIFFEHDHVLTKPAKNPYFETFTFTYRIDGGDLKKSEFYPSADRKGGLHGFSLRHRSKLKGSDFFDKDKLDANLARKLERYQQSNNRLVANFLSGANAVVQVWDFNGKAYSYDFELVGASSQINILSDCYSPVS